MPLFRNRGRTQHKLSKFLGENSSEKIAVDKLLNFTSKHYVTISRTVEEYENDELSKRRVIIASVYRFCCLVTTLRYLLPSIFHTETMISIMSDPNYLLSKPRIMSLCVSTAGFVIFSYGMLVQVNEVKHKWHLLTFLYDWKHCRLMALNAKHKKKLGISINLMFKFFYQQFWPLVLFTQVVFSGATIVAYFDHKYDFYVISMVFFNTCFGIFCLNLYCFTLGGFVAWSVPFFYFKYKFREISGQIQGCVKWSDLSAKLRYSALKKYIHQHNTLSEQVEAIDRVFKFLILLLYYAASPSFMAFLYLSHAKDTNLMLRLIAIFYIAIVFSIILVLNLIASQISGSARQPLKYLFRYLIQCDLTINDRLKIMQFVEKLSGPDIGFHVWNLFSMNNYTYYQYIATCVYNYFLIIGFI